jgi:hypothetical protein
MVSGSAYSSSEPVERPLPRLESLKFMPSDMGLSFSANICRVWSPSVVAERPRITSLRRRAEPSRSTRVVKLFEANIFLRLLRGKGDRAAQHKVEASKAAPLDVLEISVLFNDKKNAFFAMRIATDRAEALFSIALYRPTEALFTLKGVRSEFFNILGEGVAIGAIC